MKAYIIGAGGQGRVTLDILREQNRHDSIVFIDENAEIWGQTIAEAPVAGNFDYLAAQPRDGMEVVVAVGHPLARMAVAQRLRQAGLPVANAIHPSAVVARSAVLGVGNVLGPGVIIHTAARIGNFTIFSSRSTVDHDSVLDDGCTLGSAALITSRVEVRSLAFFGVGAIVAPRVTIGTSAIVSAGAVVLRDVPDRTLVFGNPARVLERVGDDFDWKRLL